MKESPVFDPEPVIAGLRVGTIWSPPFPLRRAERLAQLAPEDDPFPLEGGLYRVSIANVPVLGYIGQTGRLRGRLQHDLSSGVYGSEVMPFSDPHVAAPFFWIWAHTPPYAPLSASFARVETLEWWRQGLEDFAVALERWRCKKQPPSDAAWQSAFSPLAQFGKAPKGWRLSSPRDIGFRGGPTLVEDASHEPSIAPLSDLDDQRDALTSAWGGHSWSSWQYAREVPRGLNDQGLYRLCMPDVPDLFYLGYGHLGKAARKAAHTNSVLLFSASPGDWTSHAQLELRTDLNALYLYQRKTLPSAQYGGGKNRRAGNPWSKDPL